MEINIHSREQEFYRFSTDDFALIEIGIGSYTLSSLKNFLESGPNKDMPKDVKEFFGNTNASTLKNSLIGVNAVDSMQIKEFDIEDKKYKVTTGLSNILALNATKYSPSKFEAPRGLGIESFLTNWNRVQRGIITNQAFVSGYRASVYKIQTSASGCITFPATFTVLGKRRTSIIKLHLLESDDSESSRSISFKGSPIITSIPETPYNSKYGLRNTLSADAGQYFSPSQNGINNPENTVSAAMDMAFDSSTGKWQSGTQQMMMRLIDDLDAADVPQLQPQQLLSANASEYYGEIGDQSPYRIKPSKARAIPFSSENGNVHMYGPDYVDGCTGDKQAIVNVINRLNVAYKAGSVIVCSKMAGDSGMWTVINGVGEEKDSKERKQFFGNFEFQQHIIPAKLYFTAPTSSSKIMPSQWAEKIRLDYYLRLLDNSQEPITGGVSQVDFKDIVHLNLIAAGIDPNSDNPVESIKTNFLASAAGTIAGQSSYLDRCRIDGVRALDFIAENYCSSGGVNNYQVFMPPDEHIKEFALPKNIQKLSALNVEGLVLTRFNGGDEASSMAFPIFWGMLFPDGYTSETTKAFRSLTETTDIYRGDQNLSELSCAATTCVYDFRDPLKNFKFARYLGLGDRSLSFVRRTGGLHRSLNGFKSILTDTTKLHNYVSMIGDGAGRSGFDTSRITSQNNIYGLQPVNPSKIQFSSMSLESLYSASFINPEGGSNNNFGWNHLYEAFGCTDEQPVNEEAFLSCGRIGSLTATFSDGTQSKPYQEYANFIVWGGLGAKQLVTNDIFGNAFFNDSNNRYNIDAVSPSKSYLSSVNNNALYNRHTLPIGVLMGSKVSASPIYGPNTSVGRIPCMPILTCKSTLTTTAKSLLFSTQESFGAKQKKTAGGGSGPSITTLPLIGGLVLALAGSIGLNTGFPQWGGDNDIDSFGTTALHVRVFEHVPPNQLIYIGPIFTPIHFNPSDDLNKVSLITNSDGTYDTRTDTPFTPNVIGVDFQVPTRKFINPETSNMNKIAFNRNEIVTENTLASKSDWKYITVRRAKMLTGGGFAYFQPVIMISNATIKNGGSNYQIGDALILSDGSKIKVADAPAGIIKDIEFEPNFSGDYTKQTTDGLSTLKPTFKFEESETAGTNTLGSGAEFNYTFIIKYDIRLDLPPKESSRSQNGDLLTAPNKRGADFISTESSTTIDLVSSEGNNSFDIFYYYHNDPSHYVLDESMLFNYPDPQYVMCEVKGQ